MKLHSIIRAQSCAAVWAAVATALTFAFAVPSAQAGGPTDRPTPQAAAAAPTDRFIIKLRDPAADPRARLPAIAGRTGQAYTYLRAMSGGAHVVQLAAGAPSAAVAGQTVVDSNRLVAQRLMLDPEIAYAEPDRKMVPMLTPNDSLYPQQWSFFGASGGINLPAAWDITTGSPSIVVAVIDTGIRPHADLAGRTVPGYDFIGDTTVSNDGDGRDADPSDPGDYGCGHNSSWHGTHVAGTVGALSNNGTGVAGVNWASKILPARVLGACGGYTSDIVDAMRWSAGIGVPGVPPNANPARVENLSLGGDGACSNTMQSAINDVVARGAVVVVAAGNSNKDSVTTEPANCSGVISVAATSYYGDRASFSNYGPLVTISAPGTGILSTLNTGTTTPGADGYASYSGTSMSTPHVAGVVSLMLSQNPALTPAQVKARLTQTARAFPTGTGADCNTSACGAGIVDAAAALAPAPATPSRANLLSQANGGTASASSVHSAGYGSSGVNNGDRRGADWGNGGGWNDGTPDTFPDWVRVDLPRATNVSEIDVFSVQDDYLHPAEPNESMTFSQYGLVDFDVQYWDGSNWITVSGGAVTGNNQVWRKFTFPAVSTTSIRVNVRRALGTWSRVTELEAYGDAPPVNVARTANGGSAVASSTHSPGYPASGAIDGDRRGMNWGSGTGWNDGTPDAFPDVLQVNFSGTKSINEIDLFSVQDDYLSPSEPTAGMTFSQYGLVDFDVQYWNGSAWATVPGGTVDGNNLVWRKFTFGPISTNAIRVNVRRALATWSRVTEIEAYTAP